MKGSKRFRQARLFVAATTIALLTAVWSALTLHDLRPNRDIAQASTAPVSSASEAPATASQPASTSSTKRQAAPTTHTRSRAS